MTKSADRKDHRSVMPFLRCLSSSHKTLELTHKAAACDSLQRVSLQRGGSNARLGVVLARCLCEMNSLALEPLKHGAVNFLRKWQHHSLHLDVACERRASFSMRITAGEWCRMAFTISFKNILLY